MHDIVIVGIPILVILAGNLSNRSDIKDLRAEMHAGFKGVRAEMNTGTAGLRSDMAAMRSEMNVLQSDMRQFYHLTGKLEGRVDAVEKRLDR